MFKTVWLRKKLHIKRTGCAMLLGGFDGLHVGHRQLLARAKESGLPVGVMTIFDGKGYSIFTVREREEIFTNAGVDFLFELSFRNIVNKTPKAFLSLLKRKFSPKLYVCGDDFRFGANAVGTPSTIKERGQVCVDVLPLLKIDGEKVGARTIVKYLTAGDISKVNELLGERFFLLGEVVKDRGVGKTIGFPTANIAYPQEKFPIKKGVYETLATIDGKTYKGITNFGARPTFADASECTETHFIGFNGDLYGKEIKIEFVRFMRDIAKFDSVEKLQEQLQKDLTEVCENDSIRTERKL